MFVRWSALVCKLGFILCAASLLAPCVNGQGPAITLTMDSVGVNLPDTAFITVYLTNPNDSIAACEFWVQLNRPDIAKFVPVNSPGVGYDSTGTLVGGWKSILLQSISGQNTDVRILAIANQFGNPVRHDIAPSVVPRPLIRLAVIPLSVRDTLSDRVASVMWTDFPDFFSFARPDGSSLLLADAAFAPGWVGNGCEVRGDVNGNGTGYEVTDYVALAVMLSGLFPVIDSPSQADINRDCVVDTADLAILYCVSHGQCPPPSSPAFACCAPTVVSCCNGLRGNIDCDMSGSVDISDLTAMIDNLFIGFTPLCCAGAADISGDGNVDIGDLTMLIDNLFIGFNPMEACF